MEKNLFHQLFQKMFQWKNQNDDVEYIRTFFEKNVVLLKMSITSSSTNKASIYNAKNIGRSITKT